MQPADQRSFRKTFYPFLPPIGQNSSSEIVEKLRGHSIEIPLWHGGIRLPFLAKKSLDISAVFLEQSLGSILRMTLEMYEQALLLDLHESVHATLGRLRQHLVTAGGERFHPHFVPAGMWEAYALARPGRQL